MLVSTPVQFFHSGKVFQRFDTENILGDKEGLNESFVVSDYCLLFDNAVKEVFLLLYPFGQEMARPYYITPYSSGKFVLGLL